jgi:hypothetical protein
MRGDLTPAPPPTIHIHWLILGLFNDVSSTAYGIKSRMVEMTAKGEMENGHGSF